MKQSLLLIFSFIFCFISYSQIFKDKEGPLPFTPYFQYGMHLRMSESFSTFIDNYNTYVGLTGDNTLQRQGIQTNYSFGLKFQTENFFLKLGYSNYTSNYATGKLANNYQYCVRFKENNNLSFEGGIYKNHFIFGMGLKTINSTLVAYRLYPDGTESHEHWAYPVGTFNYNSFGIGCSFFTGFTLDKKKRFNVLGGIELVPSKKEYSYSSFNASLDNDVLLFPLNPDPSIDNIQQSIDGEFVSVKNRKIFLKLEISL